MKPYKEEKITIALTPKGLRKLADDMEKAMATATVGQPVPSYAFYGDGFTVAIMADQEAFHKHTSGGDWV